MPGLPRDPLEPSVAAAFADFDRRLAEQKLVARDPGIAHRADPAAWVEAAGEALGNDPAQLAAAEAFAAEYGVRGGPPGWLARAVLERAGAHVLEAFFAARYPRELGFLGAPEITEADVAAVARVLGEIPFAPADRARVRAALVLARQQRIDRRFARAVRERAPALGPHASPDAWASAYVAAFGASDALVQQLARMVYATRAGWDDASMAGAASDPRVARDLQDLAAHLARAIRACASRGSARGAIPSPPAPADAPDAETLEAEIRRRIARA